MAHSGFSGSLTSPRFDLAVDMGHPFLNRTVDGFLKIGAVGACKVAAEETFECLHRGDVSKHKVESAVLLRVYMWAWSMESKESVVTGTSVHDRSGC
ncbi:outer envelope pore protein 16, chloroplastic isoform X3 [Oryza sativa Japonica Group]|uniref:outer envelope pore protein 16, chloroplastic isoform X3 n=1 Tax=Oryza sativa subsp. japonica TaxID=39947 RepID=UPI0007753F4F|nr:outer envelope pore protein 16, chloroplastic isoform X3 [Oryza sativa Japonica Group]